MALRRRREPRDLVAQTIEDAFSRMLTGLSGEQKRRSVNSNPVSDSKPADRERRKKATARLDPAQVPPEATVNPQPEAGAEQGSLEVTSVQTGKQAESAEPKSDPLIIEPALETPKPSNGWAGKVQRGTRALEMEPLLEMSGVGHSQPVLQTPDIESVFEIPDSKPVAESLDSMPRAGVLDLQLKFAALWTNGHNGHISQPGPFRDLDEVRTEADPHQFPRANVFDDGNEIVVVAEFPGIERATLRVWLQGRTLTISGRSKAPDCAENSRRRWSERALGTFARSFGLPRDLDLSKASASYRNGLLEIRAPKIVLPQARQIAVHGS